MDTFVFYDINLTPLQVTIHGCLNQSGETDNKSPNLWMSPRIKIENVGGF